MDKMLKNANQLTVNDVDDILDRVSEKRGIARQYRKSYSARKSKLECHRATIIAMYNRGASLADIVVALRSILSPRVNCSPSTVKRFLDKSFND